VQYSLNFDCGDAIVFYGTENRGNPGGQCIAGAAPNVVQRPAGKAKEVGLQPCFAPAEKNPAQNYYYGTVDGGFRSAIPVGPSNLESGASEGKNPQNCRAPPQISSEPIPVPGPNSPQPRPIRGLPVSITDALGGSSGSNNHHQSTQGGRNQDGGNPGGSKESTPAQHVEHGETIADRAAALWAESLAEVNTGTTPMGPPDATLIGPQAVGPSSGPLTWCPSVGAPPVGAGPHVGPGAPGGGSWAAAGARQQLAGGAAAFWASPGGALFPQQLQPTVGNVVAAAADPWPAMQGAGQQLVFREVQAQIFVQHAHHAWSEAYTRYCTACKFAQQSALLLEGASDATKAMAEMDAAEWKRKAVFARLQCEQKECDYRGCVAQTAVHQVERNHFFQQAHYRAHELQPPPVLQEIISARAPAQQQVVSRQQAGSPGWPQQPFMSQQQQEAYLQQAAPQQVVQQQAGGPVVLQPAFGGAPIPDPWVPAAQQSVQQGATQVAGIPVHDFSREGSVYAGPVGPVYAGSFTVGAYGECSMSAEPPSPSPPAQAGGPTVGPPAMPMAMVPPGMRPPGQEGSGTQQGSTAPGPPLQPSSSTPFPAPGIIPPDGSLVPPTRLHPTYPDDRDTAVKVARQGPNSEMMKPETSSGNKQVRQEETTSGGNNILIDSGSTSLTAGVTVEHQVVYMNCGRSECLQGVARVTPASTTAPTSPQDFFSSDFEDSPGPRKVGSRSNTNSPAGARSERTPSSASCGSTPDFEVVQELRKRGYNVEQLRKLFLRSPAAGSACSSPLPCRQRSRINTGSTSPLPSRPSSTEPLLPQTPTVLFPQTPSSASSADGMDPEGNLFVHNMIHYQPHLLPQMHVVPTPPSDFNHLGRINTESTSPLPSRPSSTEPLLPQTATVLFPQTPSSATSADGMDPEGNLFVHNMIHYQPHLLPQMHVVPTPPSDFNHLATSRDDNLETESLIAQAPQLGYTGALQQKASQTELSQHELAKTNSEKKRRDACSLAQRKQLGNFPSEVVPQQLEAAVYELFTIPEEPRSCTADPAQLLRFLTHKAVEGSAYVVLNCFLHDFVVQAESDDQIPAFPGRRWFRNAVTMCPLLRLKNARSDIWALAALFAVHAKNITTAEDEKRGGVSEYGAGASGPPFTVASGSHFHDENPYRERIEGIFTAPEFRSIMESGPKARAFLERSAEIMRKNVMHSPGEVKSAPLCFVLSTLQGEGGRHISSARPAFANRFVVGTRGFHSQLGGSPGPVKPPSVADTSIPEAAPPHVEAYPSMKTLLQAKLPERQRQEVFEAFAPGAEQLRKMVAFLDGLDCVTTDFILREEDELGAMGQHAGF